MSTPLYLGALDMRLNHTGNPSFIPFDSPMFTEHFLRVSHSGHLLSEEKTDFKEASTGQYSYRGARYADLSESRVISASVFDLERSRFGPTENAQTVSYGLGGSETKPLLTWFRRLTCSPHQTP